MKVRDYTEGYGILVKHSLHWCEQHCRVDGKFGIVVAKEFFDIDSGTICYPVIHWEGEAGPSLTHPVNVVPVNVELPMIEVSE